MFNFEIIILIRKKKQQNKLTKKDNSEKRAKIVRQFYSLFSHVDTFTRLESKKQRKKIINNVLRSNFFVYSLFAGRFWQHGIFTGSQSTFGRTWFCWVEAITSS